MRLSMRPTAPLRPAFLLSCLLLLPVAAAAQPARLISVEAVPARPATGEPVTFTVTLESACLVGPTEASTGPGVIQLEIEEACLVDPPIYARIQVELGPVELAPGDYTVRVVIPSEFGGKRLLGTSQLEVVEASPFLVELPGGPPTDTEPFEAEITGYYPCGEAGAPEIVGDVVEIHIDGPCPLPVTPTLITQRVQIGPLPQGHYTIHLTEEVTAGRLAVVNHPFAVYDADRCVPGETRLCLRDSRFRVEARWQDFQGGSGDGHAIPLKGRDDTGLFWFFSADNVELTVKVLDGCAVNGHFWAFVAPGSTTAWEVTVTDTLHQVSRTYDNGAANLPFLVPDTAAFATCP